MFYAINCEYGVRTISEADRLVRFYTKAERDAWAAADWEYREAVTRDDARRRFPAAFRGGTGSYGVIGNDGDQWYTEW